MGNPHCPKCGKFLALVTATFRGLDGPIIKVEGTCKKHGVIDITNQDTWEYDDFFTEDQLEK